MEKEREWGGIPQQPPKFSHYLQHRVQVLFLVWGAPGQAGLTHSCSLSSACLLRPAKHRALHPASAGPESEMSFLTPCHRTLQGLPHLPHLPQPRFLGPTPPRRIATGLWSSLAMGETHTPVFILLDLPIPSNTLSLSCSVSLISALGPPLPTSSTLEKHAKSLLPLILLTSGSPESLLGPVPLCIYSSTWNEDNPKPSLP